MPYARRTDANHKAIRDGLRKCGYEVKDYSGMGDGFPDLGVLIRPGLSLLLEVKDRDGKVYAKGERLSKAEQEWAQWHAWNTRVVFSLEEAIAAINLFKQELAWMPKSAA